MLYQWIHEYKKYIDYHSKVGIYKILLDVQLKYFVFSHANIRQHKQSFNPSLLLYK